MQRFLPKSLLGQVMLVLALGLLVGQAISGVLLFRASEQRRDALAVNQIVLRLVANDERSAAREERSAAMAMQSEERTRRIFRRARGGVERRATSPLLPGEPRLERFETALADILEDQGMAARAVHVTVRRGGDDPWVVDRPRLQQRLGRENWRERQVLVAGVERADGNGWDVIRQPVPRRPSGAIGTIVFQTLVIFAVLFALLFLVLRRMTRPLAELTKRVSDFSDKPDRAIRLDERGPQDMRRLIAAHNAMELRIAAMLDEKDVMLGAIGHDLKTPLAALRVRIESVQDATQRKRMAESIEDITRTLDDILELARIGRPSEAAETIELSALTASIVEEYEDLDKPVELNDGSRIAVKVRATLLRRAIRNLIDNALRYGKQAYVSVIKEGQLAIIRIEDEGPGIPAQQIEAMLEPFQRGETSRNRATGGAGLGLTLARAIALQHGGNLVLANRPDGGLKAEIRLPL